MNNEFKKATANLKKAVPLMIKNRVAATPANYALWYTYVDNAIPELNCALEQALEHYDICPPVLNNQLYQNYIATKNETSLEELKTNIEVLLGEIGHSMTDTLADTSSFSETINRSFKKLEAAESNCLSFEEVMELIRQLVIDSQDIRHSTQDLSQQLTTASTEISRLKNQLAEVQKDALLDALSGLNNRRAFDNDLQILTNGGQTMSLILLDIDHFKSLNDDYGHVFGDTVIKTIGRKLKQYCRDGVNVYRFGGEEFAIIIPNRSLLVSRQFAENLRQMIEKMGIRDKRNGTLVQNITASFGVAQFSQNESAEAFINKADTQLYEAKQLGRNRVMPA
ncbi:GGDEF domain-containing protein [Vibrio azureus]|uniref:diguanylate cyclase n=1 Tax=Vibrio azureus NBRC 104587 TaxID=1219077 RepID=U3ACU4_9VIBR|nr:GGDEF domain-containing protein [Vibrio azureus]AUI87629.1 GGDEF domain-containing protein [Vibrio azureus]GAD77746.1 hypothetical protein VAZ01S_088_00130 [Vibrio azureus NBRC 104587]